MDRRRKRVQAPQTPNKLSESAHELGGGPLSVLGVGLLGGEVGVGVLEPALVGGGDGVDV